MTTTDNDRCICGHSKYTHAGGKCIHSHCPCAGYQKADEPVLVLEVEG